MVVAQIDQGGLSLPNRDYYLNTDEKSKLLTKYRAHIQKMFVLAGEPEAQAAADAGTVIELETAMAKAQMDNVKRRDPKNINNKMSLVQVKALTPSIDWGKLQNPLRQLRHRPAIITSLALLSFCAEEKLLSEHPLAHWQTYLRWQVIPSPRYPPCDLNTPSCGSDPREVLPVRDLRQPRVHRLVPVAEEDRGEARSGSATIGLASPVRVWHRVMVTIRAARRRPSSSASDAPLRASTRGPRHVLDDRPVQRPGCGEPAATRSPPPGATGPSPS